MTKPATGKLLIHLDVAGLAALMKAVETAMTDGSGHLSLHHGSGMAVGTSGSPDRFDAVTVTFAGPADPPDDAWRTGRPDPEPEPLLPVLVLQD
jgi:hypothetical protein